MTKRGRSLFLLTLVLIGVGLVLRATSSRPRGEFLTPLEALEAYREACLAGDGKAHLDCLAEPLRSEIERRFSDRGSLADALRRQMREVKSWTALPADEVPSSTAQIDVEEVRTTGKRRIRFRLERSDRGWLISAVEPAVSVPQDIPYGTHISKAP